jgi:UrcA family protein
MFKVIARYAPIAIAFGVLTGGSFAANAQRAEAAAQIPSVAVSYEDLNLNTPSGVDALYARLRAASRSVCDVGQRRALVDVMASKDCYRHVLETAVGNANLPTLTARHRTESAREG